MQLPARSETENSQIPGFGLREGKILAYTARYCIHSYGVSYFAPTARATTSDYQASDVTPTTPSYDIRYRVSDVTLTAQSYDIQTSQLSVSGVTQVVL